MGLITRKATNMELKYARLNIMGDSGVGKTTLISTLPDMSKTLMINTKGFEDGDLVVSDLVDLDILDVESIKDLPEIFKALKEDKKFDKYEFVVFDSLTGLSNMSIKYWETQFVDRRGNAIWDLYRSHGEALRDMFLTIKEIEKHMFFISLTKQSNDKKNSGITVPKIDGSMFEDSLRAWSDGTICLKSYEDGTRKILLQNNGEYACKLRSPSSKPIPMVLEKPEEISLTYILNLMGFNYTKVPNRIKDYTNKK